MWRVCRACRACKVCRACRACRVCRACSVCSVCSVCRVCVWCECGMRKQGVHVECVHVEDVHVEGMHAEGVRSVCGHVDGKSTRRAPENATELQRERLSPHALYTYAPRLNSLFTSGSLDLSSLLPLAPSHSFTPSIYSLTPRLLPPPRPLTAHTRTHLCARQTKGCRRRLSGSLPSGCAERRRDPPEGTHRRGLALVHAACAPRAVRPPS